MLACAACGRSYNARALDPWSLSTATCPCCRGDLTVAPRTRPSPASRTPGRFSRARVREEPLTPRLTGLRA
ncbi:MAG: hypothetical protein IRZ32_00765 [Solirubrobacteraceae bacterium]|nr:hypothetical protein [Solirubrobacteraceae bacterium]